MPLQTIYKFVNHVQKLAAMASKGVLSFVMLALLAAAANAQLCPTSKCKQRIVFVGCNVASGR